MITVGLEPTHHKHQILSLTCLPVPSRDFYIIIDRVGLEPQLYPYQRYTLAN